MLSYLEWIAAQDGPGGVGLEIYATGFTLAAGACVVGR